MSSRLGIIEASLGDLAQRQLGQLAILRQRRIIGRQPGKPLTQ
jgi:hypothetical protein